MEIFFLLLGIPLAGGIVLALTGHWDQAPEINVGFSVGTFIAACALTGRVISDGPLFAWDQEFFIDPLNVFLVTLTAFVGLNLLQSSFTRFCPLELILDKAGVEKNKSCP